MPDPLRLALPKGRMEAAVLDLLAAAGVRVTPSARGYRPRVHLPDTDAKVLKPQSIVEMLAMGRRDVGFAGADWVAELGADLVEVLDTGLDPVSVVAAAPEALLVGGRLPARRIVVATEYVRLTGAWAARAGLNAEVVRSYGATEVFPPEDADAIVDNTATGATLRANGLAIVDTLLRSSTRLYASPEAWADDARRARIEDLRVLLASVLEARRRVMIEVNADAASLDAVVSVLPAMRRPTVAPLYGASTGAADGAADGTGSFAVKAAVPRESLPTLLPALKAAGGTDVVVSSLAQIIP